MIGETGRCCRRRSCLRSITIYYDGQTITLGRNGVLFINGTEETIPYFSTSVDITTDQLGRTLVTLSNGVSVTWNGRFTAEISVPDVYEGLLEGMVHCRAIYDSITGPGIAASRMVIFSGPASLRMVIRNEKDPLSFISYNTNRNDLLA